MKTLRSVSVMSLALALIVPAFAQAQNYRAPVPGTTRSFLGLPLPQQWTNVRPLPANQYPVMGTFGRNRDYGPGAGNCASGQCGTRNCKYGNCNSGNCNSGTCPNGTCPNGSCTGGPCRGGQCGTGQCPNGNCPLPRNSTSGYSSGTANRALGDWLPRSPRANIADPFRGAESEDRHEYRIQRPALQNPVNDFYPSRYNQHDLDLNRAYFN